ncbi:DUF3604 domain-containing protein [Halieaceae bacterium IMCC14734]|uniref:DUF3604 domain-containing protein n=1 Tax=Candidatus Litorirhabdus singularis TaxID=2518993 RepID=A0ABT3TGB5_9GAMM|nr:DUF3604 domain-containing protein [Candidatus Litorirhabdus singularis]MCX2980447.1 DUF3604 domain-containing protein [Candidatus Litorirhabdus singularis]
MKKIIAGLLLVAMPALGQEYSPALNTAGADNLYWGDLHVHSNYSPDAFAFGNSKLSPDAALRFARGDQVTANNGMPVQLRRPLDFLLVADHAEFIGVFPKLVDNDPDLLATELGAEWRSLFDKTGNIGAVIGEWLKRIQDPNYEQELSEDYRSQIWQEVAAAAERNNQPGVFTAFVGYEWTAMVAGNNLHRVVVYRDDAATATRKLPFSALDSQNPEDLWAALAHYEELTQGRVMAIPHNGNVSNGLMFAEETLAGKPFDRDYATTRARFEPLYEVTQVKGDSETHPFLSPDDEFADFETWDDDNIGRTVAKQNSMLPHEYARSALKLGLEMHSKLGVNPYQFGLIGSTDAHTSLATADDNNFWGKFLDSEPGPERAHNKMGGSLWFNWKLAASGYVGVWAQENTRAALFDALERKEVYATTGPRIALRVFGGWDFNEEDIHNADLAQRGYSDGVPMGGELTSAAKGNTPGFLIQALKDPDGANLDRVQVVKGWLDKRGKTLEKVYDVALSDGRKQNRRTGKAPPVENTITAAGNSYTNASGAVSLASFWQDPEFDPDQRAFYYVRVIEIPTPRWTAYDASYFGQPDNEEIPMQTQERVYSSPIWYNP